MRQDAAMKERSSIVGDPTPTRHEASLAQDKTSDARRRPQHFWGEAVSRSFRRGGQPKKTCTEKTRCAILLLLSLARLLMLDLGVYLYQIVQLLKEIEHLMFWSSDQGQGSLVLNLRVAHDWSRLGLNF